MISRHPQIQVQQYLLDGLFVFYKGYDAHAAIALGAQHMNNVLGQLLNPLLVPRPNGFSTIYIKAAVMPGQHILNYGIIYFSFLFQHAQVFLPSLNAFLLLRLPDHL